MKKKKLFLILAAAALILILAAVLWNPILNILPIDRSGWTEKDGSQFYLDRHGDPLTGWQQIGNSLYYFDEPEGAMHTGWLETEGSVYYLGTDGVRSSGWQCIDGKDYYFAADGSMQRGWLDTGEGRYYLDESGVKQTGWLVLDGQIFFLNEEGATVSGWLETDTGRYYLSSDGSIYTGWLELEEGTYYLDESGKMASGWLELEDRRYYLDESGLLHTGWLETGGTRYYLNADGSAASGWTVTEGGRYFLNDDGSVYTGWLELDGQKYYLKADGSAAMGKLVIDGEAYFFTSTGANLILVNPWNSVPSDYKTELVRLEDGHQIAQSCYDALMAMLADCEAAGYHPVLRSAYRTHSTQQALFQRKIDTFRQKGYSYNDAYEIARTIVAVPGTSEHELGLAVDITDAAYQVLNSQQENTETQKWLMEHCWEYGFILRYPNSKSSITGIIYEPWHYRYVGTELALELKDSGLCLEEYLDQLTGDGTTCGGAG